MQCSRIVSLRKAALSLTQVNCQCAKPAVSELARQRCFSQVPKPGSSEPVPVKNDDDVQIKSHLLNFFYKLGLIDVHKYRAINSGHVLYADIVDNLDYEVFYKDFNMPDTMFSWFLITELHVWMAMLRYMAEGKYGKIARNNLVEALWNDVKIRFDKLGQIHPSIRRRQLNELSSQFNAAILMYDEGIMSDDKVLAGALWRRFLKLEGNNPELLERLVIYVRKQVNLLDKMSSKEIFKDPTIKWLEFKNVR